MRKKDGDGGGKKTNRVMPGLGSASIKVKVGPRHTSLLPPVYRSLPHRVVKYFRVCLYIRNSWAAGLTKRANVKKRIKKGHLLRVSTSSRSETHTSWIVSTRKCLHSNPQTPARGRSCIDNTCQSAPKSSSNT